MFNLHFTQCFNFFWNWVCRCFLHFFFNYKLFPGSLKTWATRLIKHNSAQMTSSEHLWLHLFRLYKEKKETNIWYRIWGQRQEIVWGTAVLQKHSNKKVCGMNAHTQLRCSNSEKNMPRSRCEADLRSASGQKQDSHQQHVCVACVEHGSVIYTVCHWKFQHTA